MPKCKGTNKGYYTGKEPSPKGLGFCARNFEEGKIKKGKDGRRWIVSMVKNGSRRWIPVKPNKFLKSK